MQEEFREYGSIDVAKIFEKCGSYYNFLKKYESEYTVSLSSSEQTIVEYFSRKLVSYLPSQILFAEHPLTRMHQR